MPPAPREKNCDATTSTPAASVLTCIVYGTSHVAHGRTQPLAKAEPYPQPGADTGEKRGGTAFASNEKLKVNSTISNCGPRFVIKRHLEDLS